MTRLANFIYQSKYGDAARAMPRITVYFLQASRSIRTVWLLEELGITDYEIEFSDRVSQKAPQEFKDKSGNPLGKFPVIKDHDLVVYESGAITEYLCEKYDKGNRLIPPPSQESYRSKVQMWIHAAEGTFFLHALSVLYARWNFPAELKESNPEALEQMEKGISVNVQKDLDWLEAELGRSSGRWLVGNSVTAADIMMQIAVRFILERELGVKKSDASKWPRTVEWLERCENSDSYKRAVERSGHTLYPKTT